MMVDIIKFSPYIYPSLPDVSDMEFIANTRRACIEFCKKTLAWQIDLEPIDVVEGKVRYDLTLPSPLDLDANITQVIGVSIDDRALIATPVSALKSTSEYAATVGYENTSLFLSPSHTSNEKSIKIRVALQPKNTSFSVPEILLSRYAESIACGALDNLCSIAGRPFTDQKLAVQYKEDFRHAINVAASEVSYGASPAIMHVREVFI